MKKEVIEENVFFLEFPKGRKGGSHHTPEDMLDELEHRSDCVCVQMKHITYNITTGECGSSNFESVKKDALPDMIRGDYYLLHEGATPQAAMQYLYGHRFWDAFMAMQKEKGCIGIVVQRFDLAPDGKVIEAHDPVVYKAFGQLVLEGEYPLPAGFPGGQRK